MVVAHAICNFALSFFAATSFGVVRRITVCGCNCVGRSARGVGVGDAGVAGVVTRKMVTGFTICNFALAAHAGTGGSVVHRVAVKSIGTTGCGAVRHTTSTVGMITVIAGEVAVGTAVICDIAVFNRGAAGRAVVDEIGHALITAALFAFGVAFTGGVCDSRRTRLRRGPIVAVTGRHFTV